MNKITLFVVSFSILFIGTFQSVRADSERTARLEKVTPQHAIAMHGAPKYASTFEHLSYVNPNAPKGGVLKESVTGSFDNLNHNIILGTPAKGLSLTVDSLMQRVWDEPFTLYGLVAETIEMPEDRDWIIFNINPKARFHNGRPMTADDVIFSFKAYREHGHPVRRRVYGFVKKVEKLSERRVKFTFGPQADRETPLILAIMPVLSKQYWQEHDITKTTLIPPLGSGPYRISQVEPGRSITYERVKDYWGRNLPVNRGMYNFDTIRYQYYRDEDVALQAFKSGNLNFRREFDISTWNRAYASARKEKGDYLLKEYPHKRPEKVKAFIFNTRKTMFSDRRVRKALSLAFHFGQINQLFFNGRFYRTESYFPNSELAHKGVLEGREKEILQPYKSNLPPEVFGPAFSYPDTKTPTQRRKTLRQAHQLLEDAGYIIKNGQRVNTKTGAPFEFEILLNSSSDEKIALFYKETLQRLGITAHVRNVEAAQFTGRLDQFEYDMVLYQWVNSLSPGNEQMNYWGQAAADIQGSRNYAGVKNPVVDTLAKEIGVSKTRGELTAYTHALDRILMQEYYSIPLYYLGTDLIAHTPALHSPKNIPAYGTVIESWWHQPASE